MPLLAFDPVKALDTLANERCSRFGVVPTMLIAMLQHPHSKEVDLSHLQQVFSGRSPVPVVVMEQVSSTGTPTWASSSARRSQPGHHPDVER